MTAYVQALVREAMVTRVLCLGGDNAFGEECQALGGLERRAWRILTHDGTVEQRLPDIFRERSVVFVAELSFQQTWVVGGGGDHAQHLAGTWFDGYNSTDLAFQHTLAKCLQADVQAQCEVFSGYRTAVVFAMLVFSLDTSMGIA